MLLNWISLLSLDFGKTSRGHFCGWFSLTKTPPSIEFWDDLFMFTLWLVWSFSLRCFILALGFLVVLFLLLGLGIGSLVFGLFLVR